jgi:hypothetical protein
MVSFRSTYCALRASRPTHAEHTQRARTHTQAQPAAGAGALSTAAERAQAAQDAALAAVRAAIGGGGGGNGGGGSGSGAGGRQYNLAAADAPRLLSWKRGAHVTVEGTLFFRVALALASTISADAIAQSMEVSELVREGIRNGVSVCLYACACICGWVLELWRGSVSHSCLAWRCLSGQSSHWKGERACVRE